MVLLGFTSESTRNIYSRKNALNHKKNQLIRPCSENTKKNPTPLCDEEFHQLCHKEKDTTGCSNGLFCYPKKSPDGCDLSCPLFCSKDEIYCPGTQPAVEAKCPGPDSCLSRIEVSSGCPNYCTPNCAADEKICPGVRTSENPCLSKPICHPIDQECPGQTHDVLGCPLSSKPEPSKCPEGQILCPSGVDSKGCNLGMQCKAPIATLNEKCPMVCPVACTHIHEVICPQIYDANGCPKPRVCAPSLMSCPEAEFEPETGCPIMKEPECDITTQQQCQRAPLYKRDIPGINVKDLFDPDAICIRPGICMPKYKPGTLCPFMCDFKCNFIHENGVELVTLKRCDGIYDDRGCQRQHYCTEKEFPCDEQIFDKRGCAIHPSVECAPNEEKCEGTFDQNACQSSPTCIPKDSACSCPTSDYDNLGCPKVVKDVVCADNQKKCPKGPSDKECEMGFTCAPKQVDGCATICPLHCPSDERSCVAKKEGNCVTERICQSLMMKEEGKTHCVLPCPLFCPENHQICTTYNSLGCPMLSCVASGDKCVSQYDDKGCQKMVDPECDQKTHKMCPLGVDADGCSFGQTCAPIDLPCPVACDHGLEHECSRGVWNGAKLGNYCVPKTKVSEIYQTLSCEASCPLACDWATEKACSNGYELTTGCPKQDSCQSKSIPCAEPLD
ncbi:zonadhesin-like [Tigriopus californicus]|uniref:zonadhesin-like n=1 Tax=Tigriopus californicus TaxID=6832 RepID=UPI0027DA62C8|nr:zonadhesin-like [Tigriopus californicus]XP_059095972.1 zonadhesin-like [Tigriopus californicus]